jgi:hypothetical protein
VRGFSGILRRCHFRYRGIGRADGDCAMLWDRCGRAARPAGSGDADAEADAATEREHGGEGASGSMVRQMPSFEHPAGSHLRLLGLLGVKQRARIRRARRRAPAIAESASAAGIATISIFARRRASLLGVTLQLTHPQQWRRSAGPRYSRSARHAYDGLRGKIWTSRGRSRLAAFRSRRRRPRGTLSSSC